MTFSGYKNQRTRTGTGVEESQNQGRLEKKTFIPLFLLKETEKAKEEGHQSFITFSFPYF